MRYLKTTLAALFLMGAAACDDGKVTNPPAGPWLGFEDAVPHAMAGSPAVAVAVADVNGDGRDDLLALDTVLDGVRIAVGTPSGYANLGSISFGAGGTDLRIAEVSRDQIADILSVGSNELRVSRGSTQGPGAVTGYTLAGAGRTLAIGDMNNDNRADVSAVYEAANGKLAVSVYITQNDGSFVPWVTYTSSMTASAVRACVFDVTGEGEADVVIATSTAAAPLVLFPNRGGPTFEQPVAYGAGVLNAHAEARLACADFNDDGYVDVLVLEPGSNAVLARYDGSDAGLQLAESGTIGQASDVAVIDADGEGSPDVVIARPAENGVDLMLNDGTGTFGDPALLLTGAAARYIAIGDVNRDGFHDLVIANASGSLSVVKNAGR